MTEELESKEEAFTLAEPTFDHGIPSFHSDTEPKNNFNRKLIKKQDAHSHAGLLSRNEYAWTAANKEKRQLAWENRKLKYALAAAEDLVEHMVDAEEPVAESFLHKYEEPAYMRKYYRGKRPSWVVRNEYYNPRTYTRMYNPKKYTKSTKRSFKRSYKRRRT